ncbi:MAG: malonate decarboxylase holo-ACP synthase [Vulcanimicrobiaceae bacterium]
MLRVDPSWMPVDDAPPWVRASLARAPWVVVRRACAREIAVGIRGQRRDQRFATRVRAADVRERLDPYALAARIPDAPRPLDRAARDVRAYAARAGLRLGITGSYGFELASGVATTRAQSDLDAVVAGAHLVQSHLRAHADTCERVERETGVRVDIEVLLPAGGAALLDLVGAARQVLVKTNHGPMLVACPG